jgi:hypothetical protein
MSLIPAFIIKKENDKNKKEWKPEFLYEELYMPDIKKEEKTDEDSSIIIIQL